MFPKLLKSKTDILQACRQAHSENDDEITSAVSEALPDVLDFNDLPLSDFENLSYVLKVKRSKPLKKLDISLNEIGDFGTVSLAACIHNVEEADLAWSYIGDYGVELLSEKIKNLEKPLKKLDISLNEIGDSGAVSLADCIHNIEEVDLSWNNVGDYGVEILSEKIKDLEKPLRKLNISHNEIGVAGAVLFAACMHNIEQVDWSGNNIGTHGMKMLSEKVKDSQKPNTDEYELKLEASSVVGVEGGKLNVMRCVVDIPPEALSSDVEIQLTSYYGKTQPSSEITPLLCCEPSRLKFAEDVSITLPTCFTCDQETALVVVRTSEDGTSWKDHQTFPIANKGELTFTVTHFSWFVVEIIGSFFGWAREKRIMGGFPNNDPPERVERLWKCLVYDDLWHEQTGLENLKQLSCCNARSDHSNVRLYLHSPTGKVTFMENQEIFESFYLRHMHQFQTVFKFAPHSGYQMIKLGLEFDDCKSETSFGVQVETIPQELPQEQTQQSEGRQEAPQSAQSTENISISGADIKDCRIGGKTVVNQYSVNVHPGASLQLPSTSGGQLQLQHAAERLAIKDASEEDEN